MRAGVGAMEAEDGEEVKGLVASEREDMVVVVGWPVGWRRRCWRGAAQEERRRAVRERGGRRPARVGEGRRPGGERGWPARLG
jgi:hypothetical protein